MCGSAHTGGLRAGPRLSFARNSGQKPWMAGQLSGAFVGLPYLWAGERSGEPWPRSSQEHLKSHQKESPPFCFQVREPVFVKDGT